MLTPHRIIDAFDRGHFTAATAAHELISAACTHDAADYVRDIPPEVLVRIRECAAAPPDTEWIRIASACRHPGVTADAIAEEERRAVAEWREGLSRWRTLAL